MVGRLNLRWMARQEPANAPSFGLWLAEINQQRRRLQTPVQSWRRGEYTANIPQPMQAKLRFMFLHCYHNFDQTTTPLLANNVILMLLLQQSDNQVPVLAEKRQRDTHSKAEASNLCPLSKYALLKSFFFKGQSDPWVSCVVKSERASVARTVDWNFLCSQLTGSVCKQLGRSSIIVDRVVLWTQRPWQALLHIIWLLPATESVYHSTMEWSISTNWFSVWKQVQQAYRRGQIHFVDTETLAGFSLLPAMESICYEALEFPLSWSPTNWFSVSIGVDKVALRTPRPWRESLLSSVDLHPVRLPLVKGSRKEVNCWKQQKMFLSTSTWFRSQWKVLGSLTKSKQPVWALMPLCIK